MPTTSDAGRDAVTLPVMAAVDGSAASTTAAFFAAEEAAARDISLVLVHVVDPSQVDDVDDAMMRGRGVISRARAQISSSGVRVTISSHVVTGNPTLKLAEMARHSVMLCVGFEGSDDSAPMARGTTAMNLLRLAPTSVAVVRHEASGVRGWVVAVLDGSTDSIAVVHEALEHASRRRAPLLALTPRCVPAFPFDPVNEARVVREKMEEYLGGPNVASSDLRVCLLPKPSDLAALLEGSADVFELLLVGGSDWHSIDQLTAGAAQKALEGTACSLVVVPAALGDPESAPPQQLLPRVRSVSRRS